MKKISFGTLYIKPAFIFQDDDGAVKLQFEADANSALGYLYDNLCKMLGLSWNYDSPSNDYDIYTNCAMHAAGDRALYGCGPENANKGGFCPQMTIGYRVSFQSEDAAAEFFERGNNYVDYWRSLYPSGVAVGTNNFCPDGGCLGLFLNRYDLYQVFKPDLGGSWVEYNGATFAPTISPAPTATGGCSNPHNRHLDKCFRQSKKASKKAPPLAWDSLGPVGQISVFLVSFMAITLSTSIFLARARKKKRRGESYLGFLLRDMTTRKKRRKKKLRKRRGRGRNKELEEGMLDGDRSSRRSKSRSRRSSSRHGRSTSKVRPEDGSRRSSSKGRGSSSRPRSRSASKRNVDDDGASSRRDKDKRRSSRSRSRSGRDGSRSRRERDSAKEDSKDMSRRQLV